MFRRTHLRAATGLLALAAACGAYAATAAAAPRAVAPRVLPACANGQIDSWLNTAGNGAAGTVYYQLEFTNISAHACSLHGFPGVSAVSISGHQIGAAATREGPTGPAIGVAPGASVTARLGIVETGDFPLNACRPVTAFGLRVYAPNQTFSDVIPWPFSVCSKASTSSMNIAGVRH